MKKIHYIYEYLQSPLLFTSIKVHCKRQVICWIENHIKKIDNYIEN